MASSIGDASRYQTQATTACKVGINGFGRIGRNVLRAALDRSDIQVAAINHTCASIEDLIYLIRYDSSMGKLDDKMSIHVLSDNMITIDRHRIALTSERDIKKLNWSALGVDYVLECTGKFTKADHALDHVTYGNAKRVLISAPSPDSPTFVYGVNSDKYTPTDDCRVFSNASCTTNCVAPVLKVLQGTFGVTQGFLTAIHAATRSQQVLDGYNKKKSSAGVGRGVFNNIIPTTTGAAMAIAAVLPELDGKVTGVSIRVPTSNVSMIDLTFSTQKLTSLADILAAFRRAAKFNMAGVLNVADEKLVSSDFIGSPYSAVIDASSCMELNSQFFKVMAWYDNEWGYSNRLLDMVTHMYSQEA